MASIYPGSIKIEAFPLASTGGKVWSASFGFFEFLESQVFVDGLSSLRILELGSGCGWLGMRTAKHMPLAMVTTSEQAVFGALEWLRHNLSLNEIGNVSAIELDWCNIPHECEQNTWDIIIGCELVYSYEGARLLPAVLRKLLASGKSVCYYAHSINRFESIDELLLEEFARNDLRVEIVSGPDVLKPGYLGSFETLFRDLELVIFKISGSD
jgi:hypothetical protein